MSWRAGIAVLLSWLAVAFVARAAPACAHPLLRIDVALSCDVCGQPLSTHVAKGRR